MSDNKNIRDIGTFFNGYARFSSIYLEDERPRICSTK